MKRVVAYSLYGTKPMYLVGAIRNAEQLPLRHPGWIARYYVGKSIPEEVIAELRSNGAEVIYKDGREDPSAMFWRFEVFQDPTVAWAMIRDCDSRFSERESAAVDDWLRSGKDFHIMRDHPAHNCEILGGLWGARTSALGDFGHLLTSFEPVGRYGEDQDFLRDHVYPLTRGKAVIHDSFFGRELTARRFPTRRTGSEFAGEVIDENEMPRLADRAVLEEASRNPLYRARLWFSSFLRAHLLQK